MVMNRKMLGVLALFAVVAALTAVPALADHAKVSVTSPTEGGTVVGPDVTLKLQVQNLSITDQATKAEDPHEGHFHVTVDKRPFIAWYNTDIPLNNLPAGDHEVKIEPVLSMHMKPLVPPITLKIKTTAQPKADTLPSGVPKITVTSPKEGETIAGATVALKYSAENWRVTNSGSDPKAVNEGHFHVTLDSRPFVAWEGDAKDMVFRSVPPGDHTLRVEVVGNGHDPNPQIEGGKAFTIKFKTAAAGLPKAGGEPFPVGIVVLSALLVLAAGAVLRLRLWAAR